MKNIAGRTIAFLKLIRYWEWIDKVQLMVVAVLCLAFVGGLGADFIDEAIVFILYLFLAYTAAYLMNSRADCEKDRQVSRNYIGDFSGVFVRVLPILCGVAVVLIPCYYRNSSIIFINGLICFLGIAYSLRPLRLKERGLAGLIAASVVQRLPFAFFFFLVPQEPGLVGYLLGWLLIIGFLIEISHQIEDFAHDGRTNTQTYIQKVGLQRARKIVYATTIVLFFYLLGILFGGLWQISLQERFFTLLILLLFSQRALLYAYERVWPGFPFMRFDKAPRVH